MKVVYAVEQKKKAVATYGKPRSYAATIRRLGHPSRHVLFDRVRESGSIGRPKKHACTPPKRYPWTTKPEAVEAIMNGRSVKDVAEENGMAGHAVLHERAMICRRKGRVEPMSGKERIEAGVCKAKARLKKGLPDGPEEPKEPAARPMPEKAMLEQELETAKKRPGRIPEKLRPKAKAAIVDRLRARLPSACSSRSRGHRGVPAATRRSRRSAPTNTPTSERLSGKYPGQACAPAGPRGYGFPSGGATCSCRRRRFAA